MAISKIKIIFTDVVRVFWATLRLLACGEKPDVVWKKEEEQRNLCTLGPLGIVVSLYVHLNAKS